jgi:predicted ArsR family transcriptional regulator
MTMHTTITSDTQAAIIALMADGRERTTDDIAARLKLPAPSVKGILGHMVKINAMLSERLESCSVYRLPAPKAKKPRAPRKPKAPQVELSNVAALNVATMERMRDALMKKGATYADATEDAYAYLWNKQPKRGKLPEMAPKHDYTATVQSRVLELIEANPGVSAPKLRALANMTKSCLSSAVQSLCVQDRAHMLRGNGRDTCPNRYYPGPRQQVAAE